MRKTKLLGYPSKVSEVVPSATPWKSTLSNATPPQSPIIYSSVERDFVLRRVLSYGPGNGSGIALTSRTTVKTTQISPKVKVPGKKERDVGR